MSLTIAVAVRADLPELAELAAQTFPLACPPDLPAEAIAAFVEQELSAEAFAGYLADPDAEVLLARDDSGRAVGYALTFIRPAPAQIADLIGCTGPVTYLSKLYVRRCEHRGGIGAALFDRLHQRAHERAAGVVWLGTNQHNERAQRFYERHGFERAGVRSFEVGGTIQADFVYVHREPAAQGV